jgi:hypothetical protein
VPQVNKSVSCAISDFHREVDENCTVLGYHASSIGNFLPTFRDKLLVPPSGLFWICYEECVSQTAADNKNMRLSYEIGS